MIHYLVIGHAAFEEEAKEWSNKRKDNEIDEWEEEDFK